MLPPHIDKQITVSNSQTHPGRFIYIHQLYAFVTLLGFLLTGEKGRGIGGGSQTVMTEEIVKRLRGQH